jgi:hypothetical protein
MAQMKIVSWMTALTVLSGAMASVLLGTRAGVEVWLGMIAPLVVVSGTWMLTERTFTRHPERLTAMMMTAFAGKLVLFGAYIALVVGVLHARPVPFVVSFAGYFIALHLTEAVCLQRLFAGRMRPA